MKKINYVELMHIGAILIGLYLAVSNENYLALIGYILAAYYLISLYLAKKYLK